MDNQFGNIVERQSLIVASNGFVRWNPGVDLIFSVASRNRTAVRFCTLWVWMNRPIRCRRKWFLIKVSVRGITGSWVWFSITNVRHSLLHERSATCDEGQPSHAKIGETGNENEKERWENLICYPYPKTCTPKHNLQLHCFSSCGSCTCYRTDTWQTQPVRIQSIIQYFRALHRSTPLSCR